MQLTIAQKEQYHEQGFLVLKGALPLAEVRKANVQLMGVHEAAWEAEQRDGRLPWGHAGTSWDVTIPADRPQRIEQLMNSDDVSSALARIATSTPVLDAIDQLIAPDQDILVFHSKTLMRAAEATSRFPWHQDFGYWHYTHHQPLHINCAVALEPQTVESGCLNYVPGSQKGGLVEHQFFTEKTISSFPIGLSADLTAYRAVPVEYEPGDLLFFGALVIHGSDINRTGRNAPFNTIAYDLSGNRKEAEVDRVVRERIKRLHTHVH